MVDFRKWFPALAVVALAFGAASTANAQQVAAFSCVGNAGVPPIVRAEGLTELVGDLVLNCTGGTPTAAGSPVPQANVQIFLNTNVTSRLVADPWSEALLMIDEPTAAAQRYCSVNGGCAITGVGAAAGSDGFVDGVDYDETSGTGTVPNVYQGRNAGANSIVWLGVPIDPPGARDAQLIRVGANVGDTDHAGRIRTRGIDRHTKPDDRVGASVAALIHVRDSSGSGSLVVINTINEAVRTCSGANTSDRATTVHRAVTLRGGGRFVDHQEGFAPGVSNQAAGHVGVQEDLNVGLGDRAASGSRGTTRAVQNEVTNEFRQPFRPNDGRDAGVSNTAKRGDLLRIGRGRCAKGQRDHCQSREPFAEIYHFLLLNNFQVLELTKNNPRGLPRLAVPSPAGPAVAGLVAVGAHRAQLQLFFLECFYFAAGFSRRVLELFWC